MLHLKWMILNVFKLTFRCETGTLCSLQIAELAKGSRKRACGNTSSHLPFQTQITPPHNDTIHLKMTGFSVNTMGVYMSINDKKKD